MCMCAGINYRHPCKYEFIAHCDFDLYFSNDD